MVEAGGVGGGGNDVSFVLYVLVSCFPSPLRLDHKSRPGWAFRCRVEAGAPNFALECNALLTTIYGVIPSPPPPPT